MTPQLEAHDRVGGILLRPRPCDLDPDTLRVRWLRRHVRDLDPRRPPRYE